jgi:hypothetical protein
MLIITVYYVPKLCFYSTIVEPDQFVVGCFLFPLLSGEKYSNQTKIESLVQGVSEKIVHSISHVFCVLAPALLRSRTNSLCLQNI